MLDNSISAPALSQLSLSIIEIRQTGAGKGAKLFFEANFLNTLIQTRGIGPYTFSITNDDPSTVIDFEGNLWRTQANEATFRGARRASTGCDSLLMRDSTKWKASGTGTYSLNVSSGELTVTSSVNSGNRIETNGAQIFAGEKVAGRSFVASFKCKAQTQDDVGKVAVFQIIRYSGTGSGVGLLSVTLAADYVRCAIPTFTAGGDDTTLSINIQMWSSDASAVGFVVKELQVEDTSGRVAANWADVDAPGEYVPVGVGTGSDAHGDFTDAADWTLGSGTTATAYDALTFTATTANTPASVALRGTFRNPGKYAFTYDLTVTGGTIRMAMDGVNGTTRSASGTYTDIFDNGSDTPALTIDAVTSFTGTISNFRIKEIDRGCGPVDGVQYFDYECGNSVDGSGVVTEAKGADIAAATLRGVQCYGSRQNLETYSNDITASSFVLTQCQLGTAKIGWHTDGSGKGAEKLEPLDTTSQARYFAYNVTQTLDQPYCFYVVVEAAGEEWVRVYNTAKTAGTARAWFHIPAGGGGSVGTLQTGVDDAGIVYLGQDRYLCWMVVTGSGASGTHGIGMSDADNTTTYTPTLVTDGIYVHAVQHTTGQLPMPYVPTTGTTVTDEASSLQYPASNYPGEQGWINVEFYVSDLPAGGTGASRTIFSAQDTGRTSEFVWCSLMTDGTFQFRIATASGDRTTLTGTAVEGLNKASLSYGGANSDLGSLNGASMTLGTDTPANAAPTSSDVVEFWVGSDHAGLALDGEVSSLKTGRKRKTQAEMNTETT